MEAARCIIRVRKHIIQIWLLLWAVFCSLPNKRFETSESMTWISDENTFTKVTRGYSWITDRGSSNFILIMRKNARPRPQWMHSVCTLRLRLMLHMSNLSGHKQLTFDSIPEPDCHGLLCCSLTTCHKVSLCAVLNKYDQSTVRKPDAICKANARANNIDDISTTTLLFLFLLPSSFLHIPIHHHHYCFSYLFLRLIYRITTTSCSCIQC